MKITDPNALSHIPREVWTRAEGQKASLRNDPTLSREQALAKFDQIQNQLGLALTQLGLQAVDDPAKNAGITGPGLRTFTLQAMRGEEYRGFDAALTAAALIIAAELGVRAPSEPAAPKPPIQLRSTAGIWPRLNHRLAVEARLMQTKDGALQLDVREKQLREAKGLIFPQFGDPTASWEEKPDTAARIPLVKTAAGLLVGRQEETRGPLKVTWQATYDPTTERLQLDLHTDRDRGVSGRAWQGRERLARSIELEFPR